MNSAHSEPENVNSQRSEVKKLLRVWKEIDLNDIEKYLLVVGDLSSECFSCHTLGIPLQSSSCPNCNIKFKYIGFRRKLTMNFLSKIRRELPDKVFIDFDDFKKIIAEKNARNLFKI